MYVYNYRYRIVEGLAQVHEEGFHLMHARSSLDAAKSHRSSWAECQYKMYELKVVTDEVEDSRKLTNKLYEN